MAHCRAVTVSDDQEKPSDCMTWCNIKHSEKLIWREDYKWWLRPLVLVLPWSSFESKGGWAAQVEVQHLHSSPRLCLHPADFEKSWNNILHIILSWVFNTLLLEGLDALISWWWDVSCITLDSSKELKKFHSCDGCCSCNFSPSILSESPLDNADKRYHILYEF